jgi:glutamate N-acetyltransferase/amino-acid N-acetyltransferase
VAAIARNNLVKCALAATIPTGGIPPPWVPLRAFDPMAGRGINGVWVCQDGYAAEDRAKVDLAGRSVTITVDLNAGAECATIWTNDLSLQYVHENSAYST